MQRTHRVGRGSGEPKPTVAFFSIQVLADVLERHETLGVSQDALMDSIDDIPNRHSAYPLTL